MTYWVKIIVLTAYLVLWADAKTRTTFRKIPNTFDLAGLKCARDHYTTALAVRYNLLSRECEPLDDARFSDNTVEKNYNYFKLFMVEIIFKPSKTVKGYIPELPLSGLSIIMYVQLLADIEANQFGINLETRDGSQMGFHMAPSLASNRTLFNYAVNQTWSTDYIHGPYLFQIGSWRTYMFEFKINSISIRTFIDDQPLNEFNHRISLLNYQMVTFKSSKAICSRIQFVYPQ